MNERHVVVFHIASFQKLAFLFFFLKIYRFHYLRSKNKKWRGKEDERERHRMGVHPVFCRWKKNIYHSLEYMSRNRDKMYAYILTNSKGQELELKWKLNKELILYITLIKGYLTRFDILSENETKNVRHFVVA